MEEESNGSEVVRFNIENKLRIAQSKIEAQLANFGKGSDTTFAKTSYVCDYVRDHILNYQDEPYLSESQNIFRRICVASELFINFCPIYAQVVDHEYAKIIKDMLQFEKYKKLSKKITSKMQIELRREKYFSGEAQRKLLKSLEALEVNEVGSSEKNGENSQSEVITRHENETLPADVGQIQEVSPPSPYHEINTTLAPPLLEGSFRTELASNITGNMTEIREATADATQLDLPILDITRKDLSLANIDAEISIRAPTTEKNVDNDISEILHILEHDIFPKEATEIEQPDNLLELAEKLPEPALEETVIQNPPAANGNPEETLESSDRWSLPSLEGVEKIKRKNPYLIIDKSIVIQDYAARALHLNRNINIQRVQVFEGPPSVVQAISAVHLMKTPSHKHSLFRDVRSSKLSTLYNRHLEVDQKPVEAVLLQKRKGEDRREVDVSKIRANTEIMEDVGMRAGMHSRLDKSAVLVEVPDKAPALDLDITLPGIPPKESLVGVPMSRIMNSTIQPPEEGLMDRINSVHVLPTPRVQQLQGKNLDARTSPPWFISIKEIPPRAKYREFDYVHNQLKKYWSISESQGMEKCITLREFFSFENEGSFADYLTLLRIVDKMSIQRKLLLEYKNGDVVIRPFELPFVSDTQLLLKEKEPVF